jgi:hypothetical protein
VDEETFDPPARGDRFVDLRDHPLQRDYWWGSPEFEQAFGQLLINDILDRICTDFGIDADFARPVPLSARPRPELGSSVLFVTESDGPSKRWTADRWASLAEGIGALGLDARLVTRDETSADMRAAGIEALRAPTPGDAGRCAQRVPCGDRCRHWFDTHRRAAKNANGNHLSRHTIFFRPWLHARAVVGDPCADACILTRKGLRVQRAGESARVPVAAAHLSGAGTLSRAGQAPPTYSARSGSCCEK